jgi:hypothetical protein
LEHRADYLCPACGKPVVLHARISGWVIPHFKHRSDSSCTYGKGETREHRAVKALLRDHYRSKGYDVAVEKKIGNRRADVFVEDLKVAFEVEFSPKETREFIDKCSDYLREEIRSLWILKQKNVDTNSVQVGKTILISMSRVLDFICFGRSPRGARPAFFAYDKDRVVVFRGVETSYMLYKEYDEYSGAGGYEYPSKSKMWLTIKDVIHFEVPPYFPPDDAKRRIVLRHHAANSEPEIRKAA